MSQSDYDINEAFVTLFGLRDFEHEMSCYLFITDEKRRHHQSKYEAFDSALNLLRPLVTRSVVELGAESRNRNKEGEENESS